MKVYQSKINQLAGTDYKEVYGKARDIYKAIVRKSKRKPYIRPAYFNKEKIFLDYFWEHLHGKHPADRFRRLKFYASALDLIKNCNIDPVSVQNPNRPRDV